MYTGVLQFLSLTWLRFWIRFEPNMKTKNTFFNLCLWNCVPFYWFDFVDTKASAQSWKLQKNHKTLLPLCKQDCNTLWLNLCLGFDTVNEFLLLDSDQVDQSERVYWNAHWHCPLGLFPGWCNAWNVVFTQVIFS